MSLELKSVEIINSLKASAESTTGESYTDLTEAVQALKNGYGNATEGGSESFVGVKYYNIDTTSKLPTVADARSLDGNNMRPDRMVYGLFWNMSRNSDGGMNVALKEVYMPSEPTSLGNTFANCASLQTIHGNLENVKNIAATFDGCEALENIPYMPNISSISSSSFRNCISLKVIKLYKKVSSLSSAAFTNCTNLTDIYVPWAEGEVANAPWGAPNENLVIHYNTTYDENHNPITE